MTEAFIDDGYSEPARVNEVPGLYPAVEFEFRPMLTTEIKRWSQEVRAAKTPDQEVKVTSKWLAKKILSWSFEGEPTEERMAKLRPALWNRLFAVISGTEAHDGAAEPVDMEQEEKN